MSGEMTFTLHSPLTEEEWDMVEDVDLDHTPEITFHTKHGKEVVFVKREKGKWVDAVVAGKLPVIVCDQCNTFYPLQFGASHKFCPNCGAKMEEWDG